MHKLIGVSRTFSRDSIYNLATDLLVDASRLCYLTVGI